MPPELVGAEKVSRSDPDEIGTRADVYRLSHSSRLNNTLKRKTERAILVGVDFSRNGKAETQEHIEELILLADTASAKPMHVFIQRLEKPNTKFFIGKGKVDEIRNVIEKDKMEIVIFDDDLSPSQVRNLENEWKCKVIDRTGLILDIFAFRAKTAQAKAQVELAQLEYVLPRLTKMWMHLSQQTGGIGTKGPGEKEIETDRRIIRKKISKLKGELRQIEKQNFQQRKNRVSMVRVALVGYTNAGKSTLMNILSKSDVFAENKLFATLDTTVRKVVRDSQAFLLSDTVGFIRKLPHRLVECFKSTLEEVREADILLHVVDISHPEFEEQMQVVRETLNEIHAADKPVLNVFNKIDLVEEQNLQTLEESYMSKNNGPCIFISAEKKINIDKLNKTLLEMVRKEQAIKYPFLNPY